MAQIRGVLEQKWFHEDITAQIAQGMLECDPRHFLVRFTTNADYPGCFTITRISSSGQPSHIRIMHTSTGFSVSNSKEFPTLPKLIEHLSPILHLHFPCKKASKYRLIFNKLPPKKS